MITSSIFEPQYAVMRKNGKWHEPFLNVYCPKTKKVTLIQFDSKNSRNYLLYEPTKKKTNIKNKYPLVKKIEFVKAIVDVPVSGVIDEFYTAQWVYISGEIVITPLEDKRSIKKTPCGEVQYKKCELLIPTKLFKKHEFKKLYI